MTRFGMIGRLLAGCFMFVVPAITIAEEPFVPEAKPQNATPKEPRKRSETADDVRGWLDRFSGPRFSSDHQRDQVAIKGAFREAIAEARKATVRIFSEDNQVALGVVVDSTGFLVSKASEVNGKLECRFADGRRLAGRVVGTNRTHDVALIHVAATDLPTITWQEAGKTEIGSWLATPGQDETPEAIGVVSAPARNVVAPQSQLGVLLDDQDSAARIMQVLPGSSAERAKLQTSDQITQVNGQPIDTRERLVKTIQSYVPGETILLKVRRGDKEMEVKAILGERGAGPQGERADFQNSLGGRLSDRRSGFPQALQHDTVLRPNQCGGPVIDLAGRAVGINIARAGRVASYAIPATTLLPLVAELKATALASPMTVTDVLITTKKDELQP